ncbi:hypothetical protein L2E82_00355 [Cichorium intybus]|uniref:Uncharacterized protein n=1 Tax=Cichorium intybus TaxID=13427 RepID=A0ACB9GWA6_CICIN|nr:hypothetical protein L2E82_00355 [Cichorium intybus]
MAEAMAVHMTWILDEDSVFGSGHLAELCKEEYPNWAGKLLWIMTELALIGADIHEVIGSAIALKILTIEFYPFGLVSSSPPSIGKLYSILPFRWKELLRAINVRLATVKKDLVTACIPAESAGFNHETVSDLNCLPIGFDGLGLGLIFARESSWEEPYESLEEPLVSLDSALNV